MTDRNEALVREAYEAYGRGDVAGMLEFVDPELEWTYLNPAFENPEPETCHGRNELQLALERQAEQPAGGDRVLTHPGQRDQPDEQQRRVDDGDDLRRARVAGDERGGQHARP